MMTEMTKLIIVLNTLGIAHTLTYQAYYDNAPQVIFDDHFDVICNEASIGGKDGLLEIWDTRDGDNICIGCLTAKDVIAYVLNGCLD